TGWNPKKRMPSFIIALLLDPLMGQSLSVSDPVLKLKTAPPPLLAELPDRVLAAVTVRVPPFQMPPPKRDVLPDRMQPLIVMVPPFPIAPPLKWPLLPERVQSLTHMVPP